MQTITIRGARTHNLKNIHLEIPRDQLIVITGLSGSGKSSLAFDTLYAEGQRRYVESLSAYARQFLSLMEKPDVDHIEGLSPAIAIEQKSVSHNPRSTVGTTTEIYDYLRLLFARVGTPYCPEHKEALSAKTVSQMVDHLLALPVQTKIMLLAPIIQDRKGEHLQKLAELRAQGFIRVQIDETIYELDNLPKLDARRKHSISVVVDRLSIKPEIQGRLADSLETALNLSKGLVHIQGLDKDNHCTQTWTFSSTFACPICGYSLSELEPRLFSFNSPAGACQSCDGLGVKPFMDPQKVVMDENKSLAEGAIRQWDQYHYYYYSMLCSLAKHYSFDLTTPFKKLDQNIKDILLYGNGDVQIAFRYIQDNGSMTTRKHAFEGIIRNMERRYRETESHAVREELSKYLTQQACSDCQGSRLTEKARNVFIQDHNLSAITALPIAKSLLFFENVRFGPTQQTIADKILKEIMARLRFLMNVGLEYLSLDRSAETLSGGETQRIRLASQIGAGLVGVLYVLDEPSIGLHQRDNARLLKTLHHLRDLGNTVIVVEHDEEAILSAQHVIDIGPGAGVHGGYVVAQGTPQDIMNTKASLTGQYLSGTQSITLPAKRRKPNQNRMLSLSGAAGNNLKTISVDFPLGLITAVTGVSGSGKSTLINDTLYPVVAKALNGVKQADAKKYTTVDGLEHLDKVIDIDQSPIGRTPRSNAATYTGLFTDIRDLFSTTEEARSRGYKVGRFSFNVKGGRCEACEGDGLIKVAMHFLADVFVPCDVCHGKRYNRETLEVYYKGKNIHEVLDMTVEEAFIFFKAHPSIARRLETLVDVGLAYIKIGQSATTLSGGEAQRIKLSKELSRRDTGQTLYILDEPTTGLHFHDIKHLLEVLQRLCERGNTIIIIEHNLDVIKTVDWIIDLGPEGGEGGGQIVALGTPETVAKTKGSHTGRFLRPLLKKG